PCNKLITRIATWVKDCSDTRSTQPLNTLPSTSASSLRSFIESLPRSVPAAPPTGPSKLPKNQFIIPVFVSSKAILPGAPSYMQMFEPRYRRMMSTILELNQKDDEDELALDSMMYGIVFKKPDLPQTAENSISGLTRRASGTTSESASDNGTASAVGPANLSSGGPTGSTSSLASSNLFGRGVFNGGCCIGPSSSCLSPWIIPGVRPGSTSEYLEFGTALKLRSVKPIYENPPVVTSTPTNGSGRESRTDSVSTTDDEMELDDDEEDDEDEGEESMDEGTASMRRTQSQTSERPRRRHRRTPAPPVEPSRYMVDGIGSWRFKVLEKGVCPDGLNLALVELVEDLDFEDEEVADEVMEATTILDSLEIAGNKLDVCTMIDCDCAASKRNKLARSRQSSPGTDSTMKDSDTKSISSVSSTDSIPSFSTPKGKSRTLTSTPDSELYECPMSEFFKSTRLSSIAKCMSSGVQYLTCTVQPPFPLDLVLPEHTMDTDSQDHHHSPHQREGRGRHHNHSQLHHRNNHSDSQVPDNHLHQPKPSHGGEYHLHSTRNRLNSHSRSRHSSHQPYTTPTLLKQKNITVAQTHNQYLHTLYESLHKVLHQILVHLDTKFQIPPPGTSTFDTILHFKLVYGEVPDSPAMVSYWIANLLDVHEGAKYELLRDDIGGVEGRIEWVLNVVREAERRGVSVSQLVVRFY
ncbi:hypothetical protein HDU99_004486, partial [Rhizoclosmatium hyalinum]